MLHRDLGTVWGGHTAADRIGVDLVVHGEERSYRYVLFCVEDLLLPNLADKVGDDIDPRTWMEVFHMDYGRTLEERLGNLGLRQRGRRRVHRNDVRGVALPTTQLLRRVYDRVPRQARGGKCEVKAAVLRGERLVHRP